MVLANGTVISASATENTEVVLVVVATLTCPKVFLAGRAGIGALGVIFELTIQVLPLYKLELV